MLVLERFIQNPKATRIITSFGAVYREIAEIKSSGGTTGNFPGDIRVSGKINVGQNNPL